MGEALKEEDWEFTEAEGEREVKGELERVWEVLGQEDTLAVRVELKPGGVSLAS